VKKHLSNEKGLTIVECIMALFLTTIMVVSLINMQSLAWVGAGKSDYLGRAVGILQRELENREYDILKSTTPTTGTTTTCSDRDGNVVDCNQAGKMFTVTTTTTACSITSAGVTTCPTTATANIWRVDVQLGWTGSSHGLGSTIMVSPQSNF